MPIYEYLSYVPAQMGTRNIIIPMNSGGILNTHKCDILSGMRTSAHSGGSDISYPWKTWGSCSCVNVYYMVDKMLMIVHRCGPAVVCQRTYALDHVKPVRHKVG